jgi:signal transduction histidine kinase
VPIRAKLATAVLLPLAALVGVTFYEVYDTTADLQQLRQQSELALATSGPTGVITALQNERAWPAVELIGLGGQGAPVEGYDQTRAATDEAITAFRSDLAGRSDAIASAFAPALDGLAELAQIRADIDDNTSPRTTEDNLVFADSVFVRYSHLIDPFFQTMSRISVAVDDDQLRAGADLAGATARQIEILARLRNMLLNDSGYGDGVSAPSEISAAARAMAAFEGNAHLLRTAPQPYDALVADHFPTELNGRVLDVIDETVGGGAVTDVGQIATAFETTPGEGYPVLLSALSSELADRAAEVNAMAEARRRTFLALAAVALGMSWVLTWIVSRSITRPLRSLTRQAKAMADHRLPEAVQGILDTPLGEDVAVPSVQPITIRTRDEVSDVADALNTVQETAVTLAVEQAVLRRNLADSFVNLGRRNQNLLGRQLDFITELERAESTPDALANLFRLDHLATRMRRNAESLLVLAGVEPPRQWAAPVRLTDVIRAALGEVEDYQRVVVRDVEPATILGTAATDLAHLVAELVENAIQFSEPPTTVDIRGRAHVDGYALVVRDAGTGMAPPAIEAANRRLAGAESFAVAPSRYLGHYVAGHLAARHGMRVYLEAGTGTGITATVLVPAGLVASQVGAPFLTPGPPGAPAPPSVSGPPGVPGPPGAEGQPRAGIGTART